MRKIIVAMLLIILSSSGLSAALTENVRAAPQNVKILSYSWYRYPGTATTDGDLIVVGEVQNNGPTVLDRVTIQGIASTASGPQAESFTNAFVENMLPQQKAPFYLDFNNQTSLDGNMAWATAVDRVALAVVYANNSVTIPYSGLQIIDSTSFSDSSGLYTVTGIVKNNGQQTISGPVWVVTTFYNASGTVVAVNPSAIQDPQLIDSLAPGDSFNFTATPFDYSQLSSQITSYSLLIRSLGIVEVATPTPSASQASPSAAISPTTTPQQPVTTSDLVYIVAIVAVVVVVISALFFIYKTQKIKATAQTK